MHEAPLPLAEGETLRLRVFLDRSSVEVFAQDGRVVLTDRVYPDAASVGVAFDARAAAPASWACAQVDATRRDAARPLGPASSPGSTRSICSLHSLRPEKADDRLPASPCPSARSSASPSTARVGAALWFLDESGFLLIPNVRRTWAPRGRTPVIWHRYRHDRISAISAVTVSCRRQRIGLYFHLHRENISQSEVVLFLRYLLRQIPGPIVLLWDGGSIHTGAEIQAFLARHPRLHVERFPAYAPDLNPDERVWGHCKAALANGRPDNLDSWLRSSASPERLGNVHLSCVPSSPAPTCRLCCVRDVYYCRTPQYKHRMRRRKGSAEDREEPGPCVQHAPP